MGVRIIKAAIQLYRIPLKILPQFGLKRILGSILWAIKMLSKTPVLRVIAAKLKKKAPIIM